jgi:DNA-binding helix-hairpin-helix protein with protein kinase domain
LKRLFKRGEPVETKAPRPTAGAEGAAAMSAEEKTEPQQRVAPHSFNEPQRHEKPCPKCGSPNDTFVHKCWMCKAEI